MRNMNTLMHFMHYFEPHCMERDGERICYVSALEYPDREEVADLFSGNGFVSPDPSRIALKYAGWVQSDKDAGWVLSDEQRPGTFPVWEARE